MRKTDRIKTDGQKGANSPIDTDRNIDTGTNTNTTTNNEGNIMSTDTTNIDDATAQTENTAPAESTSSAEDADDDAGKEDKDGFITTFVPVVQDRARISLIKKVTRYRRSLQHKDEPRYPISAIYLELLEKAITPEVVAQWEAEAEKAPASRSAVENKSAAELEKSIKAGEDRIAKLKAMLAAAAAK